MVTERTFAAEYVPSCNRLSIKQTDVFDEWHLYFVCIPMFLRYLGNVRNVTALFVRGNNDEDLSAFGVFRFGRPRDVVYNDRCTCNFIGLEERERLVIISYAIFKNWFITETNNLEKLFKKLFLYECLTKFAFYEKGLAK